MQSVPEGRTHRVFWVRSNEVNRIAIVDKEVSLRNIIKSIECMGYFLKFYYPAMPT